MCSGSGKAVGGSRIPAAWLVLLCTPAALFVSVLLSPASASALALQQVGSFDEPTYVTSDPGDPNRLFIVELDGRIRLSEGGRTTTFLDIESIVQSPDDDTPGAGGEQGLFSMAFSPDYATNHHFYVAYSGVDDPGTTGDEARDFHLDEFTSQGDSANPGSRRGVLTIDHSQTNTHYGGQLQFGPDDYLYASTGDGGEGGDPDGNAQNTASLLGKILRIDPEEASPGDYTIPAGNPFVGTAGADEVWSYGLRNPWRFSFDRLTGALTIADVGRNSWEEVNYDPGSAPGKGDNFGWNCREGAHDHPGPEDYGSPSPLCPSRVGTFTEPVFEYEHTDEPRRCSIIGGYVVRDLGLGDLYGRYLYVDLCGGELRSLNLGLPSASDDRSEGVSIPETPTEDDDVSSFGEDADCRIYVASLHGPVYRLTEPGGAPPGCPHPQSPPPPPSEPLPSNDFSFGKVKKNKKKGTAKLTLKVPGPGELELAKTKKLRGDDDSADEAGKEKLSIKPKGKAKKRLNNKGKARVRVKVTYTPEGGEPNEESKRIKLKKRHRTGRG